MHILVTGSNGFVGRWIVKNLKKKHYIIGCGTKENAISEVNKYIQWDIKNDNMPQSLLDMNIEAVIHAAVSKSMDDGDLNLSYTNLVGAHRIINLCREKKCKTVILLSSMPIIGIPDSHLVMEDDTINPLTMYHVTKAAQEMMFRQLEKENIRVVSVRIPSPIAPDMREKTIFTTFVENAIHNKDIVINGRGTRRQNYIDVRDIVRALDKILIFENAQGVYNIGSEESVSNLELAKKCIILSKSNAKIFFSGIRDPADNQAWNIDIRRLKKDIDFIPTISIDQTICDMIKYKANK